MKYLISCPHPHTHFIEIEMIVENNKADTLCVQLPAWRPGRYELGNFAKNIQKWAAYDKSGNALAFHKMTKDSWCIETNGATAIHIKYNYYANQPDGGGCYLSQGQLYVNGIHCFLYVPDRIKESCTVELKLPDNFKVATGMKKLNEHLLMAADYHELVDAPFIASPDLLHHTFVILEKQIHIWFEGICTPDIQKIENDFSKFITEQCEMMGGLPCSDYHFIYQILPFPFHHGVEHANSTVIALGPGSRLMNEKLYGEFLGVSSHEFFHLWNIKRLRPAEMMPYDYTKENYSRLGYVAEGVTTYYGDLFLLRSGVFSADRYFKELGKYVQQHADNFGRFNLSLADSSWDTWLDGYVKGIPDRKSSIYTEGCLCALILDFTIRRSTQNSRSLDDVMCVLYNDFAKKETGYTEKDYSRVAEDVAGISLENYFQQYISKPASLEIALREVLGFSGLIMEEKQSDNFYERYWGFKIVTENNRVKVTSVMPGSLADKAGIAKDDEIVAVNGKKVEDNFNDWCRYFAGREVVLSMFTMYELRNIELHPSREEYYPQYNITKDVNATDEQKMFFRKWAKQDF